MKFISAILLGIVSVNTAVIDTNTTPPVFPTVSVSSILAGVGSISNTNQNIVNALNNALTQVPNGLSALSGGTTPAPPTPTTPPVVEGDISQDAPQDVIVDEFGNLLVQVDPKTLITGSKIFVASPPTPTDDSTNLADQILNNILYGKGG